MPTLTGDEPISASNLAEAMSANAPSMKVEYGTVEYSGSGTEVVVKPPEGSSLSDYSMARVAFSSENLYARLYHISLDGAQAKGFAIGLYANSTIEPKVGLGGYYGVELRNDAEMAIELQQSIGALNFALAEFFKENG